MIPDAFVEILRDDLGGIPRAFVGVAEGRVLKPFLWEGIDCPFRRVALQNLLHCPFGGRIRDLYYESMALELVSSLLHECGSEFSRSGSAVFRARKDGSRPHSASRSRPCLLREWLLARYRGSEAEHRSENAGIHNPMGTQRMRDHATILPLSFP